MEKLTTESKTQGLKEYSQYLVFDETLQSYRLTFDIYLRFFTQNIQRFEECYVDGLDNPPVRMYDGISMDEFMSKFNGEQESVLTEKLKQWCQPESNNGFLVQLQEKLENENKQISFGNILLLATFIKEKCGHRYFVKLKPSSKELLKEVSAMGDISNIVFQTKDGKAVPCNNKDIICAFLQKLSNLSDNDDEVFEVDSIVRWDKLANKSIMQSIFIYDLTQFLHSYFPQGTNRKRGALISTTEQELICWLMKEVGLSPAVVSGSRYRQLLLQYNQINFEADYHILPSKDNNSKRTIMAFNFVPWSMWKSGDIDWSNPIDFQLKVGQQVQF